MSFCIAKWSSTIFCPSETNRLNDLGAVRGRLDLLYELCAIGTWAGGNIELKTLAADGSTYVSLPTALKLAANGCIGGYAAAGQFELVVTTATGVYANVANVPLN